MRVSSSWRGPRMASRSDLTLGPVLFLMCLALRVLMPTSCKSPAPRPAPPLSSTVSPWRHALRKALPGRLLPQNKNVHGLAPRASRGRAYQSQRLRHEGTQGHGRPDELDFTERP